MKNIVRLLLTFAVLLVMVNPVCAERTLPLFVDGAALLDTYEAAMLQAKLDTLSKELSIEIAVVTVDSLGGKSAMAFADDFYDENGYGCGVADDGVLLLVSMSEREYYITTHGSAMALLSDYALMRIEDAFVSDLSDGWYYRAFESFADKCKDEIIGAANGTVPDYDFDYDYSDGYNGYEKMPFDFKGAIFISLGIGLVAAIIVISIMKSSMITVKASTNAHDYLRADSLKLYRESDRFLYKRVTRMRRSDNSSGGRSSSHRSSSGRSHGGRGGRF